MPAENPFFYPDAILNAVFFHGRAKQTVEALNALRKGQSISIVGPRKIGKSSFLHHLERALAAGGLGATAPDFCCVYLNMQLWSSATYETICRAMHAGASEGLGRLGMPIAQPDEPPATLADLLSALNAARRPDLGIVFLLDEFEALAGNDHLDKHFFLNFGGAVNDPRRGICWVTASTRSLLEITWPMTSEEVSRFFDKFFRVELPVFVPAEAEALLTAFAGRAGVTFSPALLRYLLDLAGPHPLLLQIAGSHAFAHCAAPADQADVSKLEAVREDFMTNAIEYRWRSAWKRLPPEDQSYLVLLPIKQKADVEVVGRLRQAGLIVEEHGVVRAISPAFRRFMSKQPVHGIIQALPLILDLERNIALYYDQKLELQPKEFRILACLASQPGKVVTYPRLIEYVWGDRDYDNLERLKTPLGKLCAKLDARDREHVSLDERIANVRGVGYEFRPDPW